MIRTALALILLLTACGSEFRVQEQASETTDFIVPLPVVTETGSSAVSSLWRQDRSALFGDPRAKSVGDILTVVIEINDSAEFSNASNASRNDSSGLSLVGLFGIPQRLQADLPQGATSENAVEVSSGNSSDADGSIRRNEKLALRVAATVVEVLPNQALRVFGRQEVQLNFETRLLQVDGIIPPEDISRHNEITYDKIAQASISYGGLGQINNMHRPKLGTQVLTYLPF